MVKYPLSLDLFAFSLYLHSIGLHCVVFSRDISNARQAINMIVVLGFTLFMFKLHHTWTDILVFMLKHIFLNCKFPWFSFTLTHRRRLFHHILMWILPLLNLPIIFGDMLYIAAINKARYLEGCIACGVSCRNTEWEDMF